MPEGVPFLVAFWLGAMAAVLAATLRLAWHR